MKPMREKKFKQQAHQTGGQIAMFLLGSVFLWLSSGNIQYNWIGALVHTVSAFGMLFFLILFVNWLRSYFPALKVSKTHDEEYIKRKYGAAISSIPWR